MTTETYKLCILEGYNFNEIYAPVEFALYEFEKNSQTHSFQSWRFSDEYTSLEANLFLNRSCTLHHTSAFFTLLEKIHLKYTVIGTCNYKIRELFSKLGKNQNNIVNLHSLQNKVFSKNNFAFRLIANIYCPFHDENKTQVCPVFRVCKVATFLKLYSVGSSIVHEDFVLNSQQITFFSFPHFLESRM